MMEVQKLLTVNEAAEMLGCSASAVTSLVKTQELRAVVVGKRYRFTYELLDEYIQGHTTVLTDE